MAYDVKSVGTHLNS